MRKGPSNANSLPAIFHPPLHDHEEDIDNDAAYLNEQHWGQTTISAVMPAPTFAKGMPYA